MKAQQGLIHHTSHQNWPGMFTMVHHPPGTAYQSALQLQQGHMQFNGQTAIAQ